MLKLYSGESNYTRFKRDGRLVQSLPSRFSYWHYVKLQEGFRFSEEDLQILRDIEGVIPCDDKLAMLV